MQQEEAIINEYDNYKEIQQEVFRIECRKTRVKLFTIAAILFIFDFIALNMAHYVTVYSVLMCSIFPVGYILLGLLANKEPLAAMIIGAVILLALYGLMISRSGMAMFAVPMFLMRTGLFVYLLIAGFQSANEAQRIKKELSR